MTVASKTERAQWVLDNWSPEQVAVKLVEVEDDLEAHGGDPTAVDARLNGAAQTVHFHGTEREMWGIPISVGYIIAVIAVFFVTWFIAGSLLNLGWGLLIGLILAIITGVSLLTFSNQRR